MPDINQLRAAIYQQQRIELTSYLTRLVTRGDVAEELAQQAAVRMLEAKNVPTVETELRAWIYRVATNLAIDYLRRHSTWRESFLDDARLQAAESEAFIAQSKEMVGSPETKTIAHEHLMVCFACTLRNLKPSESASLLLKSVYGFTVKETASVMNTNDIQVKNRIQSARSKISRRFADSCALIAQKGVCYQCVELDHFFNSKTRNPLKNTKGDIDARLKILEKSRSTLLGPWHKLMMQLVDDLLISG